MKMRTASTTLGLSEGVACGIGKGRCTNDSGQIDICTLGLGDDGSSLMNQQQLDGINPRCLRTD